MMKSALKALLIAAIACISTPAQASSDKPQAQQDLYDATTKAHAVGAALAGHMIAISGIVLSSVYNNFGRYAHSRSVRDLAITSLATGSVMLLGKGFLQETYNDYQNYQHHLSYCKAMTARGEIPQMESHELTLNSSSSFYVYEDATFALSCDDEVIQHLFIPSIITFYKLVGKEALVVLAAGVTTFCAHFLKYSLLQWHNQRILMKELRNSMGIT